jgi:diguanylate cyclase (GGDEF)-like protein
MANQSERAAASRMSAELAGILRSLRRESHVPAMISAGLDAIMGSLGAEGAAVIRAAPGDANGEPEVLHRAGIIGLPNTAAGMLLGRAEVGSPALSQEANGRPIAVAVCRQTSNEKLGLVLWRRRGARTWGGEDVSLVDSTAGIVWLLLERDIGNSGLTHSSRMDPLTALLSQRAFVAEATRYIARLDRDGLSGTLLLAEVDNLETVTALQGGNGGDQTLRRAAMLLQSMVRPSDLLGRTGDAEFAIWLSGADYLTAAERAEALCLETGGTFVGTRHAIVPDVSFSIGIATRMINESFADLARRASQAMREVKVAGGGYWRVSLVQSV